MLMRRQMNRFLIVLFLFILVNQVFAIPTVQKSSVEKEKTKEQDNNNNHQHHHKTFEHDDEKKRDEKSTLSFTSSRSDYLNNHFLQETTDDQLKTRGWKDVPIPMGNHQDTYNYCQAEYPSIKTFLQPSQKSVLKSLHILHRHGDRVPVEHLPVENDVEWNECGGPEDIIRQNRGKLHSNGPESDQGVTHHQEPVQKHSVDEYTDINQRTRSVALKKIMHVPDQEGAEAFVYWRGSSCSPGQLTSKGHHQLFKLGKNIQQLYLATSSNTKDNVNGISSPVQWENDAIPTSKEFAIRSTDVWRTIQSVHDVLNGIFHNQKEKPEFNLTVVPKPIDPFAMHLMYHPSLKRAKAELAKDPIFISWEKDAEILNDHLESIMQVTSSSPLKNILNLLDASMTRMCHQKDLPCNSHDESKKDMCLSRKDVEDMFYNIEWNFFYDFGIGDGSKARAGTFLKEIKRNMDLPDDKKVFLYSVHDTTLMPLLGVYQSDNLRWPSYASTVIIEIWKKTVKESSQGGKDAKIHEKNNDDHAASDKELEFVRILQNGKPIRLPWCQDFSSSPYECPLTKFKLFTQEIIDFAN